MSDDKFERDVSMEVPIVILPEDPKDGVDYFADQQMPPAVGKLDYEPKARWSERHPFMTRIAKKAGVYTVAPLVVVGAVVGTVRSLNIGLDDLSPNPGQEAGEFEISDLVVRKFEAESSNAVGSAEVHVGRITQQLIDKRKSPKDKPNPHETIVLRDGKYKATWIVKGAWEAAKDENGDLTITLPAVDGYGLEVIKNPTLDKGETRRAAWQAIAGALGASDTQIDLPLQNTIDSLREWVFNPEETAVYRKSLGCVALAAESAKADTILGITSEKVNVQQYTPPRAETPKITKNAPWIRFQIPDPENDGEMLTIESCLTTLDDLKYSTESNRTSADSAFGLSDHVMEDRELDPVEQ